MGRRRWSSSRTGSYIQTGRRPFRQTTASPRRRRCRSSAATSPCSTSQVRRDWFRRWLCVENRGLTSRLNVLRIDRREQRSVLSPHSRSGRPPSPELTLSHRPSLCRRRWSQDIRPRASQLVPAFELLAGRCAPGACQLTDRCGDRPSRAARAGRASTPGSHLARGLPPR